jgi:DNA repair and recombination protein RAD54B
LEPDTESGPSRAGSSSRTTDTGRREIPADRFYAASKPKADRIVIGEKSRKKRLEWGGALHDPKAEGAVIMERPDEAQARKRSVVNVLGVLS